MARLAVFCSANDPVDERLISGIHQLIDYFLDQGYSVCTGGAASGLMGLVADRVLTKKGTLEGVMPKDHIDRGWAHPKLSQLIVVDSVEARKTWFMDHADVFLVLPGGLGTLDEMVTILSAIQLGTIDKACLVYNPDHTYDFILDWFNQGLARGYIKDQLLAWIVSDQIDSLLRRFKNFQAESKEVWDLVDMDGKLLGVTLRRSQRHLMPKGAYHQVVFALVQNSQGQILLQKRSQWKLTKPLSYDFSVGGSVLQGETSDQALIREAREELGLDLSRVPMTCYHFFEGGHSFIRIYVVQLDVDIKDLSLDENEVASACWLDKKDFDQLVEEGKVVMSPWRLDFYHQVLEGEL